MCWWDVLKWTWCLWCYSECASTLGKLKHLADHSGNRSNLSVTSNLRTCWFDSHRGQARITVCWPTPIPCISEQISPLAVENRMHCECLRIIWLMYNVINVLFWRWCYIDVLIKIGFFRIIPVSRPIMLDDFKRRIRNAYGHDLTMSYINNDITIPIKKQMDLDNAVALLDFSPQLTSLRIYLSNEAGGNLSLVKNEKSFFKKSSLNNNGFWGEKHSWVGQRMFVIYSMVYR